MRVLVVGGAGYLGERLCAELSRQGDDVIAFDRANGSVESGRRTWDLRIGSVGNAEDLDSAFDQIAPDVAVNLAYVVGEPAERSPSLASQVNVLGSALCLELAARHGARRLVYSSSIAVYGTEQDRFGDRDITEDDGIPMLSHATSYGATKSLVEFLSRSERHRSGLETVGLRLSVVLGSGRERGFSTWISDLIVRSAQGLQTTVHYAPEARLNLIPVGDAVELLALLVHAPGPLRPFYNSGGQSLTVGELVGAVRAEHSGADIRWADEHLPHPPFVHRLSNQLLREDLGFQPSKVV